MSARGPRCRVDRHDCAAGASGRWLEVRDGAGGAQVIDSLRLQLERSPRSATPIARRRAKWRSFVAQESASDRSSSDEQCRGQGKPVGAFHEIGGNCWAKPARLYRGTRENSPAVTPSRPAQKATRRSSDGREGAREHYAGLRRRRVGRTGRGRADGTKTVNAVRSSPTAPLVAVDAKRARAVGPQPLRRFRTGFRSMARRKTAAGCRRGLPVGVSDHRRQNASECYSTPATSGRGKARTCIRAHAECDPQPSPSLARRRIGPVRDRRLV